jgi:hypothetical protein
MRRDRTDGPDGLVLDAEDETSSVLPDTPRAADTAEGAGPGSAPLPASAAAEPLAHEPPRRRRTRGPDKPSADGQPVSARRLAANRANAARSTGPRTEAGKAVARFNALRHGLAAQTALLPGEDDEALAELTAEFEADHAHGSAAERAVAGRLVSVVWKLRRLARAEEDVAAGRRFARTRAWATRRAVMGQRLPKDGTELDGPDPMPLDSHGPRILADDLGLPGSPGRLERLMLWDVRLGGELMRACRQLAAVRKAMGERSAADRDAGAADGIREVAGVDGVSECERVEGFDEVSEFGGVDRFDGSDASAEGGRPAPRPDGAGHAAADATGAEYGSRESEAGLPDAEDGLREVEQLDARPLTLTLSPAYGGEGTGGGPRTSLGPRSSDGPQTADGLAGPDELPASHGPLSLQPPDVSRRSAGAASAEPTHCSAAGRASGPPLPAPHAPARRAVVPIPREVVPDRRGVIPLSPRRFDGGRPPRPWTAAVGDDRRPAGVGGDGS